MQPIQMRSRTEKCIAVTRSEHFHSVSCNIFLCGEKRNRNQKKKRIVLIDFNLFRRLCELVERTTEQPSALPDVRRNRGGRQVQLQRHQVQ